MKKPITQDILEELSPKERCYLKQVIEKREHLEKLKAQESEIYSDIKNAHDLMSIYGHERMKALGIKQGATVIFKPTGTKHTLSTEPYLDRENNLMAVNLSPIPKLGGFRLPYAHELEVVKTKKKQTAKK